MGVLIRKPSMGTYIQPRHFLEIRLTVSVSYNKRSNKMIMVDVQLVLKEIIFQNNHLEEKEKKNLQ